MNPPAVACGKRHTVALLKHNLTAEMVPFMSCPEVTVASYLILGYLPCAQDFALSLQVGYTCRFTLEEEDQQMLPVG